MNAWVRNAAGSLLAAVVVLGAPAATAGHAAADEGDKRAVVLAEAPDSTVDTHWG